MDIARKTGSAVNSEEREITCLDGSKRNIIFGAGMIGENLLVSFVDITDRKKAERDREKLQEQLYQSQKLEALGFLAGGLAHDFNNMLGAIMGYAEMTLDDMDPSDRSRENLGRILEAARRSTGLTRQLLAFARKQDTTPTVFDVNNSVEATLAMLRRLIGENIKLDWRPEDGSCLVRMDPSQFDQILANLCINAKDAIADVGKIAVETSTVSIDDAHGMFHEKLSPGDYVRISVRDNGCGMDQETTGRIFEPFYTTKALGQGTGLGLSTVYGIVKQNNGMIDVSSEPGRGTAFDIYLPKHSAAEEKQAETAGEIPRSRGGNDPHRRRRPGRAGNGRNHAPGPGICRPERTRLRRSPAPGRTAGHGNSPASHGHNHAGNEWTGSWGPGPKNQTGNRKPFHFGLHGQHHWSRGKHGTALSFFEKAFFDTRTGPQSQRGTRRKSGQLPGASALLRINPAVVSAVLRAPGFRA